MNSRRAIVILAAVVVIAPAVYFLMFREAYGPAVREGALPIRSAVLHAHEIRHFKFPSVSGNLLVVLMVDVEPSPIQISLQNRKLERGSAGRGL